jgi:hypothetical protein
MEVAELRHYGATSLAFVRSPGQRKSIHSLSTGALAALAVLVVCGCAGRGAANAGSGTVLSLVPVADMVQLAPNQAGSVSFRVLNGGVPAPGRTVSFAIVASDPAAGTRGATLTAPSAVTDAGGVATAGVRAGLATTLFQVQAQIGAHSAAVSVIVEEGTSGTVLVAPFFTSADTPQKTTKVQILFYDATTCAAIDPDAPMAPARPPLPLPTGDQTVAIPAVSTASTSAVFVQAIGLGPTIVAAGCVDVPGSTVLPGATVEVAVPLADANPDPVGTFALTSTLIFSPRLAAAAALAAPWQALSACPLDPAQLWLDCTVDALSAATPGDPLDCVPATAPGAEGPIGDALMARRGAWLVDGAGTTLTCRSARDGQADESLDALVQGLFGSPTPPAVVALPAIAADAASLLAGVRFTSLLAVAPGSRPGSYLVTHTLQAAQLGPGWSVTVPLAALGLPVLQAAASGSVAGGTLNIARHGFTFRLGSTARAAFGPLALVPRGFPSDAAGFVGTLFGNARRPDGATGCAALDATVCPAIGQSAGCLLAACAAGLNALAASLDDGFAAADGAGVDLTLAGAAPLVAAPGTLRTQRLGTGELQPGAGAAWTASVETTLDDATLTAPFDGIRQKAQGGRRCRRSRARAPAACLPPGPPPRPRPRAPRRCGPGPPAPRPGWRRSPGSRRRLPGRVPARPARRPSARPAGRRRPARPPPRLRRRRPDSRGATPAPVRRRRGPAR